MQDRLNYYIENCCKNCMTENCKRGIITSNYQYILDGQATTMYITKCVDYKGRKTVIKK